LGSRGRHWVAGRQRRLDLDVGSVGGPGIFGVVAVLGKAAPDDLEREEVLSLLAKDPAEALDVVVVELAIAGWCSLGVDQPLALQEANLGDRHVWELIAQQSEHLADGKMSSLSHAESTALHLMEEHQSELAYLEFIPAVELGLLNALPVEIRAIETTDIVDGECGSVVVHLGVTAGNGDVVEEDVAVGVTADAGLAWREGEAGPGVRTPLDDEQTCPVGDVANRDGDLLISDLAGGFHR